MGWLNFGGKKRKEAQGFGNSKQGKSRPRRKTFILEKIVTPSAGVGGWLQDFDPLHQLLGSLSLSDLHLPNFFADSGVCPIDPSAPTDNLPPLIDFDPLGLYHDGIATQTPYNIGGAFETLPVGVIPIDPQSPNANDPNAIRQLLDFPLASQPLVGTIDTGVSANSPYLNYANIKKGRDYVDGDDNPLLKPGEGSEHGTFMLGIIDAINKTAPKWVGRAIDSGRWADSLVEFVDAAKASGQKNAIANLSLDLTQKNPDGSVTTRYELTPAERSAIEYARQNGVMLVVAAGNDGGVMSVLGQASQEFDNIFTVGAGDINGRSIYSSFGRGLDIVADGGTTEHPALSTVGNDLGTMAGTSVATAKVTGAISLVWAANPGLSYRQVIEILEKTARDLGAPGRDDETGFGFLNTLAAVELAKKTAPEVYNPTPWVTPGTWSGEGKVTPEERPAKGGNSIAEATVQVSTNFSDIDRVDANQPQKYYQFTVNEPGYVRWNLTSLNPVSGFPTPPEVTVTKADGKPGSHTFFRVIGAFLESYGVGEGQTSFQGGNFYDPGTYYLKVGNGAGSTFNDYNISTQFIADQVSSFTGNIQYRTQPSYSLDNSLQSAVFSGPAVSELSNLSGVVTYDNINFKNRIAKYGVEVNESGKIRINLNSPNGKMGVSVKKFIGSDDRPESIASLEVSANSDRWLELDLNKGRYDIEVSTPSDVWLEPDWNPTQQKLVRPYTLNATFAPNAPQAGQGKVPSSAGAFDKTVVSNGVVNHYYKNGYLTVQPSGEASWYSYGTGNAIGVIEISAVPLPFEIPPDYAGNSPDMARDIGTLIGTQTFHDVIDRNDRFDYYKFNITSESKVDFALSGKMGNTGFYLFQNWYFNSDDSTHIDRISGTPPGVVPEFSETLKPGTYYVLVHKPKDYDGDEYDLKLSATPVGDPDGNYSIQTAANVLLPSGGADLGDGVNSNQVGIGYILSSIGGKDLNDFYKFSFDSLKLVNFYLAPSGTAAQWWLLQDRNGNGQVDPGEAIKTGTLTTKPLDLDVILGAGDYYLQVGSLSSDATSVYAVNVTARPLENQVIAGYNSDYYLVQNGQLRLIPNQETLNALKINPNTVKRFSNEDLALIPTGQELPSTKDGSLLSVSGGGKVYQMQSGQRRWIPDAETFNAMGLDWSNIKYFPINDIDTVQSGQDFPSQKDGSLLSVSGGGKVYQMQSGQRRWIPDAETFNAMGLDWSNIKYFSIEDVNTIPQGQDLPSRKDDGSTNNRKPVITTFPDFQMVSGTSFSLQTYANRLQISDPDGDAIQFYEISVDPTRVGMEAWTLEGQPLGKYLIPADKFNTINFYGSVLGSNPVVVRAFDGKEWSDPKSFNINVVASSNTGGVAITPGNGGSPSTTSPSSTPTPVSNNGTPLLQTVNAQYFLDRPQFYTTGNLFFPYNAPVSVGGTGGLAANCTWYASGRVKELGGRVDALSSMTGNAGTWGDNLSHGAWMPYEPLVGDIAEWVGDGHVAVVEKVNYNSDGSIRDIVISESNYAGSLHHIRTIGPGQSGADATGWPDRFIRVPKTGQITLEDSFDPNIYDDDPKLPQPDTKYWRFDKAVTYMYKEMVNNIQSPEAKNIKLEIEEGTAGYLLAIVDWYKQVNDGQEWDHKRKDKLPKQLELGTKYQDFYFQFPGDDKYEYNYDIWSNIHYGYVGAAVGFSSATLQTGSGLNDWVKGTINWEDVEAIELGIYLWQVYKNKLTEEDFRREILQNKWKFNRKKL